MPSQRPPQSLPPGFAPGGRIVRRRPSSRFKHPKTESGRFLEENRLQIAEAIRAVAIRKLMQFGDYASDYSGHGVRSMGGVFGCGSAHIRSKVVPDDQKPHSET